MINVEGVHSNSSIARNVISVVWKSEQVYNAVLENEVSLKKLLFESQVEETSSHLGRANSSIPAPYHPTETAAIIGTQSETQQFQPTTTLSTFNTHPQYPNQHLYQPHALPNPIIYEQILFSVPKEYLPSASYSINALKPFSKNTTGYIPTTMRINVGMSFATMTNQKPINVLSRYAQQNVRNPNHSVYDKQLRKAMKAIKSVFESKKHYLSNSEEDWIRHCKPFLILCQN